MSKLVDVPFLKFTMRHSAAAYCAGNNHVNANNVVKSGIFINPHNLEILAIGIRGWEVP